MGVSLFRVKLITRKQNLLDCFVHSLIVPALDGQIGIMRGHAPMVCELGLGIMVAKNLVSDDGDALDDRHFLIDGGFAQIAENNATVLAYDVTTFDGIGMDEVDKMIERADKILSADAYATQIRSHEVEKAAMIKRLARQSKLSGSSE
jgi:F-type H+-transporting ATPase subunit epsilon